MNALAPVSRTSSGAWTARHTARLLEFLFLFVAMPLLLTLFRDRVPPIPVLLAIVGFALLVLLRDPQFDRRQLISTAGLGRLWLRSILPIWLGSMLFMGVAVYMIRPEWFVRFPRENFSIWVLVMCFYPIFSVIPQTIIYRVFFDHRYRILFGGGTLMLVIAAASFALAHVIFKHWMPVLLTFGGGLIFFWRYQSSRSAVASAIEHAMHGNMIFTIGLGFYFYHGSQRVVQELVERGGGL